MELSYSSTVASKQAAAAGAERPRAGLEPARVRLTVPCWPRLGAASVAVGTISKTETCMLACMDRIALLLHEIYRDI